MLQKLQRDLSLFSVILFSRLNLIEAAGMNISETSENTYTIQGMARCSASDKQASEVAVLQYMI